MLGRQQLCRHFLLWEQHALALGGVGDGVVIGDALIVGHSRHAWQSSPGWDSRGGVVIISMATQETRGKASKHESQCDDQPRVEVSVVEKGGCGHFVVCHNRGGGEGGKWGRCLVISSIVRCQGITLLVLTAQNGHTNRKVQ